MDPVIHYLRKKNAFTRHDFIYILERMNAPWKPTRADLYACAMEKGESGPAIRALLSRDFPVAEKLNGIKKAHACAILGYRIDGDAKVAIDAWLRAYV